MGLFSSFKKVADPAGAEGLLKGKDKTYAADPLAGEINDAAGFGLGYFKRAGKLLHATHSQNTGGLVDKQIGLENRMLRTANQDASRGLGSLIARRGLQNSSVGLMAETNANRNLAEKIALNNATTDQRKRDAHIEGLMGRLQAGQMLMGPKFNQGPIQLQNIKRREGGLASMIGTLGGAAIGAKSGNAMAGAQAGGAMGSYYQNS